jgi:hypothetical protein
MQIHSLHETKTGSKSRPLAGLGSSYSPQTYFHTLHRGYGWGRMMDDDIFPVPAISAFHNEVNHLTKPAKDRDQTRYPISWH